MRYFITISFEAKSARYAMSETAAVLDMLDKSDLVRLEQSGGLIMPSLPNSISDMVAEFRKEGVLPPKDDDWKQKA